MKSEQFKHNLAKHKRQAKQQREDANVNELRQLFQDFGKIYTNNKN
jgi:hypothetical protein